MQHPCCDNLDDFTTDFRTDETSILDTFTEEIRTENEQNSNPQRNPFLEVSNATKVRMKKNVPVRKPVEKPVNQSHRIDPMVKMPHNHILIHNPTTNQMNVPLIRTPYIQNQILPFNFPPPRYQPIFGRNTMTATARHQH